MCGHQVYFDLAFLNSFFCTGLPQKSCDDFDLPALTYTETTKDR